MGTFEIVIAFGAAAFGSILSFLLPAIVRMRLAFEMKGLSGVWFSISHTGDDKHGWETDQIKVAVSLFGVEIKNLNNPRGYSYQGRGHLLKGNQLAGRWSSTRPGATSEGWFLLIVNPQAKFMYGLYSDTEGQLLGWCLAREEENVDRGEIQSELERAKKLIQSRTFLIPDY